MELFGEPNIEKLKDKKNVKRLIKLLNHKDYSIVWHAAEVLGDLNDLRAVESLLSTLNHAEGSVRHNVAEALGKLKDIRATQPLIASLKDEEKGVRYSAAVALGEIRNPQAVKPLINSLKDEHSISAATDSLVKMDKAAVKDLISALKNKNASIRLGASKALGEIQDPSSVEHLAKVLDDEDYAVRREAAHSMAKFKDLRSIKTLMEIVSEGIFEEYEIPLGEYGIGMGVSRHIKRYDIKRIVDDVVSIGEPAVNPLINYIKNEYSLIPTMILGELKDPRAIKPLMELFKDSRSYNTVSSALAKIGEPAVEFLVKGLKDKNPDVSSWSRITLIEMEWTPHSEDERISFHIAGKNYGKLIAIGKLAIDPLINAAQDKKLESWEIKRARQALKQMVGEDLGEDPTKWLKWWRKNKEKF